MRKYYGILIITLVCMALLLGACAPSPHRQLGFQAMLTDPAGIPVPDGEYKVIVRIWNHETESDGDYVRKVLEDNQLVTVTDGFLNIAVPAMLDDAHALNPAEFAQPLWAEFEIDGEILKPRQKLLATPLAFSLVGGSAVAINEDTALPLIDNWPNQGAFNVLNAYLGDSDDPDLKGTTGLVISIGTAASSAQLIRACAGPNALAGLCDDDDLVFTVFGDGDVTATGAFTAGGSGYAELMRLSGSAKPGDVLRTSMTSDRSVFRCGVPNDTRVVGVYVENPGFIAGGALQDQPNMIPVAFSGIVPVKVTADNGTIDYGDLLTCSSNPGYAMKATNPQIGAILGKAMEIHSTGTGVIDVLLTLQ